MADYKRGNPGGKGGAYTGASRSGGSPALSAGAQKAGITLSSAGPPKSDKVPLPPRRTGPTPGAGQTKVKTGYTNAGNPKGSLSRKA